MKKSLLFFQNNIATFLTSIITSSKLFLGMLTIVLFVGFSNTSYSQTTIDCAAGPVNTTYCYTDNDTTQFVFTNTGGFPLNLLFNAGEVEVDFDELIVLDSDGVTNLNAGTPYGAGGNLAGISYQSSGDTITIMIDSDTVISCQTQGFTEWDFDVWCQTCLSPTVTFATDGDCTDGSDFNIFVDITDMGSATSININDDQGSPQQNVTTTGVVTFGPYSFDTDVVITVSDANDLNCVITSNSIGCLGGGPGSLFINAGDDITLSCNEACTDISANFLPTFESFTDTYTINEITYDPPFAFNGLANSINTNIDDAWSPVEDLPFDFCYFQNIETQFIVGSNGVISFQTQFGDGFNGWQFDEDLPNNTNGTLSEANIFTPGHDIDPSVSSTNEIAWEILGNFPNRVLVVSYFEVPYFSCNDLEATHMAVFYEFSNVIEIYIQDKPTCDSWNDGNTVLGIQNNAGNIAYVPDGRNTSDSPWTTSDEAWSFSPAGDPTYVFEWVDSDGVFISNDPTINVCPEGGEETYTAKITYTNCNGDVVILTDDVTVTLVADFTLLLPEDQVFCDEESYEIIPETTGDITGATYLWSPGGETTPTITVTTSGTYTLEMTRDDCSATDSITVTFNDRPIVDLGEDFETCFEEELTLDASPSNYDADEVTYEWSFNATVIAGETNATLTVSQVGTYSVIVTYEDCDGTDSITISPANDIAIDLGEDFETCFEEEVILDASPSNYDPNEVSYEWSFNGTVIAGETNATLLATQIGTYSVIVTFGECTAEDSILISPANDIEIDLGNDIETCYEEEIILDASPSNYDPNEVTYEWSFNSTIIASETNATLVVGQYGTYSVIVTFGECTAEDSILISPANDIEIDLGEDFETCFEEQVILDATPSNYDPNTVSYEWSLDGTVIAGETNVTLIVTQNGTYTVTVTFGECTSQDSININPRADLEVTVNDDFMLCPNEPKIITSSTPETGVSYQWFVDGNLIAGETGSTIEVEVEAGLIGSQTYTVVITLGDCTGTDSVDVTLYPVGNCVISQGISPNGSIGFNDILDLTFLDDRTGISKLQIFNRLGAIVYDKNNYTNQWRGQTNDGNDLPTGTYFFVIDLLGEDPVYGSQHTGWIYLNQEAN